MVPTNQTWRLTWSSPYEPYDITPAYDVHVSKGDVTVGDSNSFLVSQTDETGGIGFLANSGPIVLWLSGGAHFYLANDFIRVHMRAYQIRSMDLKMVTECSAEEGARICFERLRGMGRRAVVDFLGKPVDRHEQEEYLYYPQRRDGSMWRLVVSFDERKRVCEIFGAEFLPKKR